MEATWFAVADIAVHDGFVTSRRADDDWTYQDVTGAHGAVLYEGPSEDVANTTLDAWLTCDAPSTGRYCYTHNPARRA